MAHTDHGMDAPSRSRETPRAIQLALVELVVESGYDNVTISEIAERARVSRSTFYGYFDGKEDLLRQSLRQLHAGLQRHWRASLQQGFRQGELSFLRPLVYHLQDSSDLWQALRRSSARPIVVSEFKAMVCDLVARDQGFASPPSDAQAAVISCVTGAFMELVDRWLRGAIHGDREAIAAQLQSAARAVTATCRG